MSLSEQVILMRQSLDECERELKSLEGGRKASAPRARKSFQALKQSSHAMRKQITESVKSMPVKSRTKKEVEPEPEVVEEPVEPVEVKKTRKPRTKKQQKKMYRPEIRFILVFPSQFTIPILYFFCSCQISSFSFRVFMGCEIVVGRMPEVYLFSVIYNIIFLILSV